MKPKAHQWVGNLVTCAWYFLPILNYIPVVSLNNIPLGGITYGSTKVLLRYSNTMAFMLPTKNPSYGNIST